MISILDRYLLRSLLVNYGIAVCSMVSLYVVLDMFVNMDEFTESTSRLSEVARNVAGYYWPNLFLYFSQLSGAITLFACLMTIARMRQLNELTALLASGVSLYRVARPIVLFGMVTTGLLVVDSEWIIPSVAHLLARDRDDADGKRAYEVLFLPDRGNALLSAGSFHPTRRDLRQLLVLTRDESGTVVKTLEADHAVWEPPTLTLLHGRWVLQRGVEVTRARRNRAVAGSMEQLVVTRRRYYESDLSPEDIQLRQSEEWIRFLSLTQLRALRNSEASAEKAVAAMIHRRQTAPIVSLVLLLLGLPFFLHRSPANLLNDAGKCLIACGLCYVVVFVSQSIRPETVSALPAWIPILVFGTVAVVLVDRIRT